MADSVKITCAFSGTDFKRQYKLECDETLSSAQIKNEILAVNASLAGGTAGGLSSFIISDDFDESQGIGFLTGISAAQRDVTTTQFLDIEGA